MAILNINELQNPINMSYIKEYMANYSAEALANLGQRLGVKGDGIKYGKISFYNMLDGIDEDTYSSDDYIGVIQYVNNTDSENPSAQIGVVPRDSSMLTADIESYELDTNTYNNFLTTTTVTWDILINNIEEYLPSSVIHIDEDGEFLYTMLYGKINGTLDEDDNNLEVIYNVYDLENNTLTYSLRARNISYTTSKYNLYVMYELSYENGLYTLNIYGFNSGVLYNIDSTGDVKENFEKLFSKSSFGSSTMHISNYVFTDFITDPTGYKKVTDTDTTVFGLILNNGDAESDLLYTYTLDYNADAEIRLSSTDADNTIIYFDNDNQTTLQEVLVEFNNDITYSLEKYLKYYSYYQYSKNLNKLTRQLFYSLYEKLYDAETEDSYSTVEYKRMFVPLNLEITFIQSDTDNLKLYFSQEFVVTEKNFSLLNDYSLTEYLESKTDILYNSDTANRSKIYSFSLLYDDEYITGIKLRTVYSLPTLTSENTWEINGIDTQIYAIGRDAGNPNIILTYVGRESNGNLNYTILSGANEYELYSVDWNLQHYLSSNNQLGNAYIPDITNDESADYFNDSLLINIDRSTENYSTSLWKPGYDYENNKTVFSYITLENKDTAFDFNEMFNVSYILNSAVLEDALDTLNYPVDQVIFKANNNSILNTFTDDDSNYLTVANQNADDYNLVKTTTQEYNNNLNLSIHYNTDIENNGTENIKGTQKGVFRYIDDLSVTNTIYPEYEYTETTYEYIEKVSSLVKKLKDNSGFIEVVVDGETAYTNVISLNDITNQDYDYAIEDIEKIYTVKNGKYVISEDNYYNEYIPNSNVPSLDLSEILLRDVNTINRMNVISFDNNGNMYNSYFGTVFDSTDKSSLHIGTSKTNINVGNQTLFSAATANDFNTQNDLYIDIDNTHVKTLDYDSLYDKTAVDNYSIYYTTTITPIGRFGYVSSPMEITLKTNETDENYLNNYTLNNTENFDENKLFHTINYDTSVFDYENNILSQNTTLSDIFSGTYSVIEEGDEIILTSIVNTTIRNLSANTNKKIYNQKYLAIKFTEINYNNKHIINNSSESNIITREYSDVLSFRKNMDGNYILKGKRPGTTIVSVYNTASSTNELIYNIKFTVTPNKIHKYGTLLNINKLFNDKLNINLNNIYHSIKYNGFTTNIITLNNCENIILGETSNIYVSANNGIIVYPDNFTITYTISNSGLNKLYTFYINNNKGEIYSRYNELYNTNINNNNDSPLESFSKNYLQ